MDDDNARANEPGAPRMPLPDIVQGEGDFKFSNGDRYVGGFEAKKINLTVTKHVQLRTDHVYALLPVLYGHYKGPIQHWRPCVDIVSCCGEYITWDGHVYKANWINDQLNPNEDITIEFSDSSKYHGSIQDGQYSGLGTYSFPDKSSIRCVFKKNVPTEDVLFVDKQGISWIGGSQNNNVKLQRLNIFHSSCPKSNDESISEENVKLGSDI